LKAKPPSVVSVEDATRYSGDCSCSGKQGFLAQTASRPPMGEIKCSSEIREAAANRQMTRLADWLLATVKIELLS
jgi:hypothetical protein